MAELVISLEYALGLRTREGYVDAAQVETEIREVRGDRSSRDQRYKLDGTAVEVDGWVQVRLAFTATLTEKELNRLQWAVKELGARLQKAVAELASERQARIYHRETDRAPAVLWRAVEAQEPQATVRVPLLKDDKGALVNDEAARRAVVASVREVVDFWRDEQEQLAGLQVRLGRDSIVLVASSPDAAVDVAWAYLTARRRRLRPWESLPPRPVWAIASALIALVSFGLSWAPLTWATLGVFAGVTAAIAAGAIMLAPRRLAWRGVTAWGLAPILTLSAFAFCYGAVALADPAALALNGQSLRFLREPFLLSLSLLSTVGVLDFHLAGWVRSLAYLEMLLVAGLAGGAALVAARRLSHRADAILNEIRRDRGDQ